MNVIAIELSITGNPDDIEDFINDFQGAHNDPTSYFYPLNCNNNLTFDDNEDSCLVRFESVCSPSKEWLKMLREKYSSFNNISVFWHNICEVGELGFIEKDGTEYEVGGLEDLKEAVKMYARNRTTN